MTSLKLSDRARRVLFILTVIALGTAAVLGASSAERSVSAAMTAAAGSFLLAAAAFSGRRGEPAFLSLVSVLTALSLTGRIVFAPFAGFKPCTAVIIIAGACLGSDAGFICGTLTALVSNIYFGQGTWTLYQMFAWGLIGIAAGLCGKLLLRKRPLLYVFAAVSGLVYSLIMDIFSTFWESGYFDPLRFTALAAGSLPLTATYAVSNVIFMAVLSDRMSFAVMRIKKRYGVRNREPS